MWAGPTLLRVDLAAYAVVYAHPCVCGPVDRIAQSAPTAIPYRLECDNSGVPHDFLLPSQVERERQNNIEHEAGVEPVQQER